MKLCSVLTTLLILALQLQTTLCRPRLSGRIVSGSLQALNLTLPSAGTGLWLNATADRYPIEWPIHRTSMILYMQHEARSSLKLSETLILLDQTTSVVDSKDESQPLGNTFECRLHDDGGPLFAVGPSLNRRELNWEDVSNIVGGLIQYYIDTFGMMKKCPAISFMVDDRERGAIGWGVIIKAKQATIATAGLPSGFSSTS